MQIKQTLLNNYSIIMTPMEYSDFIKILYSSVFVGEGDDAVRLRKVMRKWGNKCILKRS